MSAHLSEWTLRRLHTGELPGEEAARAHAHVAGCEPCQGVLAGFVQEQRRFEVEVPFERFASGVEGALRQPRAEPTRPQVNGFLVALAATVLMAVSLRPLLESSTPNRLKGGGASADLRIQGEGPQRAVVPGHTEKLLPGERVRLGYEAGPYRYVLAVSVDDLGEVSALYPEQGRSLAVNEGGGRSWLPDSREFTGRGQERVVVVLSDEPLEVEAVRAAARRAWEAAGGKVAAMQPLGVGGQETHWLLRKP